MVKSLVEVLVDDLDGTEAVESVMLGWNGQWRRIELSEKNLAALSKAVDRFWEAGRPVAERGGASRRTRSPRAGTNGRDPKAIRAWAEANGIAVPKRGRIPGAVEKRYNQANR
jgi:nucleoid-associated protein Lsr2